MLSLIAALLLAAAPEKPVAAFDHGVCLAPSGSKVAGQVLIFSPTHALVKDEEGHVIELWGSFLCFRAMEPPKSEKL